MDFAGIAGLLGGIAGIIGVYVAIRNSQVSAKKGEVEILRGIIKELNDWRDGAQKRIASLEAEVAKWKAYALLLCDQMRAQGMEPPGIEDL